MTRLYHGSKGGLVGSIAPTSRDCCDFGRGFYLGDSPAQPQTLICHHENPMFYVCDLDLQGLRVFDFTSRHEWAFYIAFCRGKCERFAGTKLYERIACLGDGYDVLKGKIANDRMFMVLNDFFDGAITDKAMIALLECLNLGTQYCCRTGETSQRIYAQAPLDVPLDVYPGMHALSPEMAIEDLRNRYCGHAIADGQTVAALKAIGTNREGGFDARLV